MSFREVITSTLFVRKKLLMLHSSNHYSFERIYKDALFHLVLLSYVLWSLVSALSIVGGSVLFVSLMVIIPCLYCLSVSLFPPPPTKVAIKFM